MSGGGLIRNSGSDVEALEELVIADNVGEKRIVVHTHRVDAALKASLAPGQTGLRPR